MELRDLIVTPFVILAVYLAAYVARPMLCDRFNYRYFFPALTIKIFCAIALGVLYQFYYSGGDTFNYHTFGSRIVWGIFMDDPLDGLSLIFLPYSLHSDALSYIGYASIPFYDDPASFFIIRVASLIDLFTFSTYSATAVVFSAISFIGSWMMFLAFYRVYPFLIKWLALAIFFIPSVCFWGSGLMKDTLVMAALGGAVFFLQSAFMRQTSNRFASIFGLVVCLLLIYLTKKYVLLCFVPAAILLVYLDRLLAIRSLMLRIILIPAMAGMLVASSYYSVVSIGEGDSRYSLDKLAKTAQITAYDIGFYTGRDAGSRYSIGTPDGTFAGMIRLAPQAINVTLFRPYLWEVRNPLMVMAAAESLLILLVTLLIILRNPVQYLYALREPFVLFCIVFSITFAFAVGVSTFNFGTLVRYKIPMMPFYAVGCLLIFYYTSGRVKVEADR